MAEVDQSSTPSSSSSARVVTSQKKKVSGALFDTLAATTNIDEEGSSTNGPGTDGSTLTPEGSSLTTEEVLGTVNLERESRDESRPDDLMAAVPQPYSITLDRSSGMRLGMSSLEHLGQTLLVTAVTGGLVEQWNESAKDKRVRVRAGDCIVAVNGIRSSTNLLLEECKKHKVLHMEMLRPPCEEIAPGVHTVALSKTGCMKLGIDISQHDGRTLLVTEIREGIVKEWNRLNPCHQVRPGDRIIKVNACQNNARKLLEECRKNEILRIVIKRAKARIDRDPQFTARASPR